MNVELILDTFNRHQVDYLLIGGMNFFLRHRPDTTLDVDLWIEDSPENRGRCHNALVELKAEWGPTDEQWGPVSGMSPSWLATQSVFCLDCPAGAVDIFRVVEGLDEWRACRGRAETCSTKSGLQYLALSDADMLRCQLALPEHERRTERVRFLKDVLNLP
jgi:hypothetical protein